ncbi:MAG TPA: hypothetical protein VKV03_00235 [Candidatus Binataceae bacterium]|nr:hypothetical protein [Candidatus Binataceae bacterium]
MRDTVLSRVSISVIVIALVAGSALRLTQLGAVPPGFHPDEAVEGYDAYSILKTGRDHRGNFLPLAMQSFNDYRMPLFQYSLVPLVATFGLKPAVIRLGAALWGIADLLAVTAIALLMLGLPGAAAASLLYALSPWHLPLSRIGSEMISASSTVSLAMLGFLLWLKYRDDRWLFASAIFFGLSLYTYSITKASTPLMMALLAILCRREIRTLSRRTMLVAAIIFMIFAAPQIVMAMSATSDIGGRFAHLSIWSYGCPSCGPPLSIAEKLENIGASFAGYLTPSFLFIDGDRGDHWTLIHPPGFGQLFPEQAALIVLALASAALPRTQSSESKEVARDRRRKKRAGSKPQVQPIEPRGRQDFAIVLIGWLVIAALPAAAIVPLGAYQPEAKATVPTAEILLEHPLTNAPMTPELLMAHPDSRHAVLQMAPWTLLSALGFVMLLELGWASGIVRYAVAGLLLAAIAFHGAIFVRSYFRDYPMIAAPYFQYGLADVIHEVAADPNDEQPVVITYRINQPYIYVLFYEHYPPAKFQGLRLWQFSGVSAPVIRFDRYLFVSPEYAYSRLAHGTFVYSAGEQLPQNGGREIRYPDGGLAYTVIRK